MVSPVAAFHLGRRAPLTARAAQERSIRRRVGIAWGLLFINTLTFVPGGLLPIPHFVGKGLTQGALPLAILVALTVNPKITVRPNVFLCLVSLLVVGHGDHHHAAPAPRYRRTGLSGSPSSWSHSGC